MSVTSEYTNYNAYKPHSLLQYPIEEDLSEGRSLRDKDGRSLRDLKSQLEQLSSINSNISLLNGSAFVRKNEGVSKATMDRKRTVSQPIYRTKYDESRLVNDEEYKYRKQVPESSPALIQKQVRDSSPALIQKLQSTAKSLHTLQAQSYVLEQSKHDMNGEQIISKTVELQAELNEVIQVLHKVIAELLVDREQTLKQLREARQNDFPSDHHTDKQRSKQKQSSGCFITRWWRSLCNKMRGKHKKQDKKRPKRKPRPSAKYYEDSNSYYSNGYAESIHSSTEYDDVPPVQQRQQRRRGHGKHVTVKRSYDISRRRTNDGISRRRKFDEINRRKYDEINRRKYDEASKRTNDEISRRKFDEISRNDGSIYQQQYIKKLSSSQATTSFSKVFKTHRNNSQPTRNLRR